MSILHRKFALIRRYVLGVLLVVPLFFMQVAQSQAYIVQTNVDGEATGILGMSVDGVLLDIDFEFGSFNDLYGGVIPSNSGAIVGAIITELNTTTASNGFPPIISAPLSFFNPGETSFFLFPTIGDDLNSYVLFLTGSCPLAGVTPLACVGFYSTGVSISSIAPTTETSWAVPSPSAVPLPAALPLFGSALAMLGIVGWRRKRRAAA